MMHHGIFCCWSSLLCNFVLRWINGWMALWRWITLCSLLTCCKVTVQKVSSFFFFFLHVQLCFQTTLSGMPDDNIAHGTHHWSFKLSSQNMLRAMSKERISGRTTRNVSLHPNSRPNYKKTKKRQNTGRKLSIGGKHAAKVREPRALKLITKPMETVWHLAWIIRFLSSSLSII